MNRRALVTGGAGFIGSRLAKALADAGWQTRVLDDLSVGRREKVDPRAELIVGDICDSDACRRACEEVDTVFHLAARVSIRHSVATFVDDAEVNLLGTLRLLAAAGTARVRRFVFTSSMAVYADGRPEALVDEGHKLAPLSPYGVGKLAAEEYVRMMAPRLGLEPVVLRLFNTYGAGQGYTPYVGVATIFITRILQGESCVIFGDGQQRRDFTHVTDVTQALLLAADARHAAGATVNIGTGIGTSVSELAELIRTRLGRGRFDHAERDVTELRYSVADIARAKKLLGYAPRYRLEDRLDEVIDSIRAQPIS